MATTEEDLRITQLQQQVTQLAQAIARLAPGQSVYPAADLPLATPGASDSLIYVDEAGRLLRRGALADIPVSALVQAELDEVRSQVFDGSPFYPTAAAGIAAVADGAQFKVEPANPAIVAYSVYQRTGATANKISDVPAAEVMASKADQSAFDDAVGGLQRLGNSSPVAGAGAIANANFTLSSAPAKKGQLSRLVLDAHAAGTVYLGVYRAADGNPAPGSALTRLVNQPLTVTAGANTIDLTSYNVQVLDGDLVGITGNGIVSYTLVPAGGPRYYSVTGSNPTLGSLLNDNRWEFGIDVEYKYSTETPLGADVADVVEEVRDPSDGLATKASRNELAKAIGSTLQRIANIAPVEGVAYTGGFSIVSSDPITAADKITKVIIGAAAAGVVNLVVYRPPAGVTPAPGVSLTRVLVHVINVEEGINTITADALPDFTLQPGDLVGVQGQGIISYTAVSAGGPRYYQTSGANPTLGGLINDSRWEWGVEVGIEFNEAHPLYQAVIEYVNEKTSGSGTWQDTECFIVVWGNGQSLMASRALTPSRFVIEEGRSYKWDPNDGIVHLVDPTGTDAIAQTGRASMGPALAQAVLEATNGRVGVIFINTAIGSTKVSSWRAGGSSWTAALQKWDAAIADIRAKKLNVIGVAGIVDLGQTDAADGTSPGTYTSGILELRDNMRAKVGVPNMPFIMSQLGIDTDDPTSASWDAIRAAQSEMARNGDIIIAHRRAKYFGDEGWMQDNLHYNSQGEDEVGGAIGVAVAAFAIGSAPLEFDS